MKYTDEQIKEAIISFILRSSRPLRYMVFTVNNNLMKERSIELGYIMETIDRTTTYCKFTDFGIETFEFLEI